MEKQFTEYLPLKKIVSSPQNARKKIGGRSFDGLVKSIKVKGILEPIIVRPKDGKFEVVAGERRFRAACKLTAGSGSVPAIIRELTDEEAFEISTIENLQREDLTPLEEAQGFKTYLVNKDENGAQDLADTLGVSPRYIRKRVQILQLPKKILNMWEKGELLLSHLELLMRLDDPERLNDVIEFIREETYTDEPMDINDLRDYIERESPKMDKAPFNQEKASCLKCSKNTDVQKKLFGGAGFEGTRCLDKVCFRFKVDTYLKSNWKKLAWAKKSGTNGFAFMNEPSIEPYEVFYDYDIKPGKKCFKCDDFKSLVDIYGQPRSVYSRVCLGDKSCYNSLRRVAKEKKEGKKAESGPRVEWHGEFFREKFYETKIPEQFNLYSADDEKMARLALYALIKEDYDVRYNFAVATKFVKEGDQRRADSPTVYDFDDAAIFKELKKLDYNELLQHLKRSALTVLMKVGIVGAGGRHLAAEHLGIRLNKEWAITDEYLEKKTIKEMLAFGKQLKIFDDSKVKKYLTETLKKKEGAFDKCKKSELVDLFLKSGVKLVGKVPDEIIPK